MINCYDGMFNPKADSIIVGGDANKEIPGDSWNRMNHILTNADIERMTKDSPNS